jgi:hypothetical protein
VYVLLVVHVYVLLAVQFLQAVQALHAVQILGAVQTVQVVQVLLPVIGAVDAGGASVYVIHGVQAFAFVLPRPVLKCACRLDTH